MTRRGDTKLDKFRKKIKLLQQKLQRPEVAADPAWTAKTQARLDYNVKRLAELETEAAQ